MKQKILTLLFALYLSITPVFAYTEYTDLDETSIPSWVVAIIIAVIVATVTVVILIMRNKMIKKSTHACEYLDEKSIKYTNSSDNFVGTNTVRMPMNNQNNNVGIAAAAVRGSGRARRRR